MRFAADGSIPPDNPFGPTNPTFVLGLRTTFDFTFDPLTGLLWGADNGDGDNDEVNLHEAGLNYGWPAVAGTVDTDAKRAFQSANPAYREPLAIIGRAPTGMAFNPAESYGAALRGDLFIAEFVTGVIRRVRLTTDRRAIPSVHAFAQGIPGGMNDLEFAPSGEIYVSTQDAIYRLRAAP